MALNSKAQMAKSIEKITKVKEQNTVKATATMPVSVALNGNVKEPNDVTDRRNGFRNPDRLTCCMLHALCSMLFLIGCASVGQKDRVLALVDGDPVTEGDLQYSLTIKHRKEDLSSAGSLNISRYVNKLIDDRLLVHEARTAGMDRLPEIKQALEAYILRESVVRLHKEEIVEKVAITEDDLREYYKKNHEQFSPGLKLLSKEDAPDIEFDRVKDRYTESSEKTEGKGTQ